MKGLSILPAFVLLGMMHLFSAELLAQDSLSGSGTEVPSSQAAYKPFATDSLPPFPSPEWRLGSRAMGGAIADFSANSSGLTGAFYEPFLFGGHIDRKLKERTLEGMEAENRFGGDRRISIGGSIEPDSLFGDANEERKIFFRLIDGRHFHSQFTRDLFRTVFMGNAGSGERLELAPFQLNSLRYRQFKIGILDQRGDFEMGIALSGIQGVSDLSIQSQNAHIEEQDDPSELGLRLEGVLRQNGHDPPPPDPFSFQGSGFGIDVMAGYDFHRYGQFRFTLSDMGLLTWKSDSRIQRVDTNFRFQGIRIENPLEGNEGDESGLEQVRDRYFPEEERRNYRTFLPGGIRMSYSKKLPSDVWIQSRFRYRLFAAHTPFVALEGVKEWKRLKLGLSVGHGGYGELALGLSSELAIGKRWSFYLRSQHLEGILFPRSMGGIGASAGLHYSY